MIKITGLDELSRTFQDAAKALEGMDEIGTVSFDPEDPGSIESAITEMSRMIDERLEPYGDNPIVADLAESMKESYRDGILEQAAAARLKGGES